MIAIMLDTNVIHRDAWLTSEPGQKLLQLAKDNRCKILYPQVVRDELHRQHSERARAAHRQALDGITGLESAGINVKQITTDLDSVLQQVDLDLEASFLELLESPNVVSAPVPKVDVTELLKRDLQRRRPFHEIKQGQKYKSAGFRDTLVWETLLEAVTQTPTYTNFVLVTSDKGFLSEDSLRLHSDLESDLRSLGVAEDLVTTVKTIPLAISIIESTPATSQVEDESTPATSQVEEIMEFVVKELKGDRPTQIELATVATDALYDLMNKEISMSFRNGGEYGYPDFVSFTVPNIESGYITNIDQITEFAFEERRDSPDSVFAIANAIITIEGAVNLSAWFSDDYVGISITEEISNGYFEANSEVEVRVVIEIDVEDGQSTVLEVILEDPPSRGFGTVLDF